MGRPQPNTTRDGVRRFRNAYAAEQRKPRGERRSLVDVREQINTETGAYVTTKDAATIGREVRKPFLAQKALEGKHKPNAILVDPESQQVPTIERTKLPHIGTPGRTSYSVVVQASVLYEGDEERTREVATMTVISNDAHPLTSEQIHQTAVSDFYESITAQYAREHELESGEPRDIARFADKPNANVYIASATVREG